MDADRVDLLSRSLSTTPSRRDAVRLLLGSVFGGLVGGRLVPPAEAHDLSKKCKKKSGKARKTCLKKAKKHNATHTAPASSGCTPNCHGKDCGDDGCGGSCGPCTGGSCSAGACVCPDGLVVCGSRCATGNGSLVSCPATGVTAACCSGTCQELFGTGVQVCRGRAEGDACEVPAQCATNTCTGGVCRCPSGQMRKPGTAECCTTNGSSCAGATGSCCAGTSQCTGAGGTTCTGLPRFAACDFDEQCANENVGCNGGFCGPMLETA